MHNKLTNVLEREADKTLHCLRRAITEQQQRVKYLTQRTLIVLQKRASHAIMWTLLKSPV